MSSTISLYASAPGRPAWCNAMLDIRDGALATAHMVVTFTGCVALLAAAIVLYHDGARSALRAALPFPATVPTVATSSDAKDEPASEAAAAPAAASVAQDPRQKHVVQYLSKRYRVAEEATRMLVAAAFQIGHESKMDPLLILSVVAVESSLNPFAESAVGAQGLMQVMPRVHADRFEAHGGKLAALDPIANMKVGSAILNDLIARGGSVERGLQLYVGAGNQPDDGGYGARVLSERARLALASTGKVDAAIASGRPASPAPAAPEAKPATTAAAESSKPAARDDVPENHEAPGRSA